MAGIFGARRNIDMTSKRTVPPVSGSDDARSSDTRQSNHDRKEASKAAKRAMSSQASDSRDTKTASLKLAEEYLRLGGRRLSKTDDNITKVRQWEEDPPEAERFWKERIEPLADKERTQVEIFLPSINDR
jgi:hypothetical protein